MSTQLILHKPEINPDVYFENNDPTFWTFGTGWTYGNSNVNGLGAEKLGVALSDLKLYLSDQDGTTDQVLYPARTYTYKVRVEFCTNSGGGDYCKLIVGGTTILTIPASGSPTIYTASFTTGSTGDVKFTSTSGNSILISYINLVEDPENYVIDITDEIDVPLNMAIADIRDASKRNGSFSRTVNLPGTKQNSKFFNHAFEISASGIYNPNKKVKAEIYEDGILQFEGFCKLDHINRLANGLNNYHAVSYDITLLGYLAELFFSIGDTLISELGFSEYDHVYSRANQRSSWYSGIIKNGASYSNTVDGSYLTITSSSLNAGRVQMDFSGAHGLSVGDWLLIPENSIVSPTAAMNYYLGEHMVYSVPSSTQVVLQCPYYGAAGSITTKSTGTDRVRAHYKKGEGYVYPMIDYDQNNGTDWNINQFYPAIYGKEIVDKIFKKINCVYDSTVLNSKIFKKAILPAIGGSLKLTNDQVISRMFKASNSFYIPPHNVVYNSFTLAPNSLSPGSYIYHQISGGSPSIIDVALANDSADGCFDNGNNFNTGTYKWVCPANGIYSLRIDGGLFWCYSNVPGVSIVNQYITGVLQIEVYDYTLNQVVGTALNQVAPNPLPDDTQTTSAPDITFEVDNLFLTSGNNYGVRIRVITVPVISFYTGGSPYLSNITVNYGMFGIYFSNKIKNTYVQSGDTVYMNTVLPKMKCTEFLYNIIKMFNIYVDKDKTNDKKYILETRDDYYSGGSDVDLTDKLDTSQRIQLTPMGELMGKILTYNYSEDSDFYNKDHKNLYGQVYGNKRYRIDNDFLTSSYATDITFAPTILVEQTGKIISNIQKDNDTNGQQDPFASKQRILIFNCASSTSQSWLHTVTVGGTSEAISSGNYGQLYPYAGHLDKPDAPYFDLNFDYPSGVYFAYDSWTDRNLWNLYYKKHIHEVTSKESEIVSCYLHLKASDIFKLDFRNRYIIDGHFLRLNKVSDYLVGKNIPVLCEFIKVLDKPPFVADFTGVYVAGSGIGAGFQSGGFNNTLPYYMGQGSGSTQGSNSSVSIIGASQVGAGSYNVSVIGDGNLIGYNSNNIVVTGYNNTVYPNLSNVSLINTNGITVTQSNVSYLNGQNVTNIQAKILRLST